MNFISRQSGNVIKDKQGKVVKVIADIHGECVPFIFKNGKVDLENFHPNQPLPKFEPGEKAKMYRQLYAIFRRQGKNKPSQTGSISKNARQEFIQAKIKSEAEEIHALVAEYYLSDSAVSYSDYAWAITKEQTHKPVLPGFKDDWHRSLRKWGIKILEEGWLLIPRWERQSNGDKKLVPQIVDGINSAIRMQDYILSGYRVDAETLSEISRLEIIEDVITRANRLFVGWKNSNESEKNLIQSTLVAVVLQLEKCRNRFKVAALEQVENVIDFEDILHRVNPGAKAARTISALNNLSKRFLEMGMIAPFIALRRELLIFEKRRLENKIRAARSQLKNVLNNSMFSSLKFNGDDLETAVREINKVLYFFNTILISPYWEQSKQAGYLLAQAKIKLATNEMDKAKQALNTGLWILEADMSKFG